MLSKLADGSELIVAAMDKTKDQCKQTAENTAQVHGSLDIMNTSVEEINNINNQIAGTAEKQSGVAAEINRNMNAISKMVTELSANAEITVTSAQNLATANTQLTGIVNQFKLKWLYNYKFSKPLL